MKHVRLVTFIAMANPQSPGTERDHFLFKVLEIAGIFITAGATVYIAYSGIDALNKNTQSNLTACRSQLYGSDSDIEKEEFEHADSALWTLYSKPETHDPVIYCQQLLGAFAIHEKSLANIPRADLLYKKLIELNPPQNEVQDITEMRKASAHLALILDELHSAYDYWSNGVITDNDELKTWQGYVTDIGPHPLFLADIWEWHEQKYMSRNFAQMLRNKLLENADNRAVIHKFYPDMEDEERFLKGLPKYGRHWKENDASQDRSSGWNAAKLVIGSLFVVIAILAIWLRRTQFALRKRNEELTAPSKSADVLKDPQVIIIIL